MLASPSTAQQYARRDRCPWEHVPPASAVAEPWVRSTSGYAPFPDDPEFQSAYYADPFREWTPDELIAIGTQEGTSFPPGTSWQFSDTTLVILGQIVEQTEGRPLGEVVHERILDPLDLAETDSPLTPPMRERVLHAFTDERGPYEDATFWNPSWIPHAGNMTSTLGDMMTWAEAIGTGSLLTPESHEIQTGPGTVGLGPMTDERFSNFGVGGTNGWVYTNPRLMGYNAALAYLPSEDLRVVVAVAPTPRPRPRTQRRSSPRSPTSSPRTPRPRSEPTHQ